MNYPLNIELWLRADIYFDFDHEHATVGGLLAFIILKIKHFKYLFEPTFVRYGGHYSVLSSFDVHNLLLYDVFEAFSLSEFSCILVFFVFICPFDKGGLITIVFDSAKLVFTVAGVYYIPSFLPDAIRHEFLIVSRIFLKDVEVDQQIDLLLVEAIAQTCRSLYRPYGWRAYPNRFRA
jgi:hypothetical protein